MALISVIVPTHNVEKYIIEAMDSIINQTFTDFEVICVDDCSTDNTYKILSNYAEKDNRIKVIQNEVNLGPGSSRNIALELSSGKYIACIDGDDTMDKTYLEKAFNKLEETNIDAVWVKANIYWEEEDLTTPISIFPELVNLPEGFLELTPENIYKYPAYSWNKILKRDSIIKNDAKWSDGLLFEDVEFYYRFYTQSTNIYVIDEPLYLYRRRLHSIISDCITGTFKFENLYTVIENIFNFLVEKGLFEKYKPALLSLVAQSISDFDRYPDISERLAKAILILLENIKFPDSYKDCEKNLIS